MRRRLGPSRNPRTAMPLHFEVVERHVYTITDRGLAKDVRQALAADDMERLAELIDYLNIDGPGETRVSSWGEVTR